MPGMSEQGEVKIAAQKGLKMEICPCESCQMRRAQEREFLRNIAISAHTTGKRLWIEGESYLVVWSLYPEKMPASSIPAYTRTSLKKVGSAGKPK